jgi:hypothetical protein
MAHTSLPATVIEAIDALRLEATAYGRSIRVGSDEEVTAGAERVATARAALLRAIDDHVASVFEGGVELGRAQGS